MSLNKRAGVKRDVRHIKRTSAPKLAAHTELALIYLGYTDIERTIQVVHGLASVELDLIQGPQLMLRA